MATSFEYAGRDLESMGNAKQYHRHILRLFGPYLGRHVAEIGAGDGEVTKLIAELAPDRITAIEPSDKMFALLKRSAAAITGPTVTPREGFLSDFAGQLQQQPADSFIYINVFEHIEDDLAEMRRVYELLPSGGHLCIFVPALPSLYSEFDRSIDHFRRYRRRELEAKVRQAGFSVRFSRYFDLLGVVPWWVKFKLLKSKGLNPGAVKAYDRFGVPVIRAVESVIAPPVGKNVILVARKD